MAPGRKISNVLSIVRSRAETGDFIVLPHAIERGAERNILVADIVRALMSGRREPERDEYRDDFQSWNYAIRGDTVDGRGLRVAVAFDHNHLLIITVIRISKRRR